MAQNSLFANEIDPVQLFNHPIYLLNESNCLTKVNVMYPLFFFYLYRYPHSPTTAPPHPLTRGSAGTRYVPVCESTRILFRSLLV